MKSADVQRTVRSVLNPWCKSEGFTRGTFNSWKKKVDERYVVFWFQCSRYGWDAYSGSELIVEFQCSTSPNAGDCDSRFRHRLPTFLSDEDLVQVFDLQNTIIKLLPPAPPDHHWFDSESYQALFQEVIEPYGSHQDIWLRYRSSADVEQWARFVLTRLPMIVPRLLALNA